MARDLRVGHTQITLAAAPDAEGKVQQRIRTGAIGIGETLAAVGGMEAKLEAAPAA